MNNHERPSQPRSNESSQWDDVAALADQYEDRDNTSPNKTESIPDTTDKTTFHINLGSRTPANCPINTRPEETFQIPGQYHVNFGSGANRTQPPTPHEVLRKQRHNETISSQAAIDVIESQIKLNDFQTTSIKSQIDTFKSSHGFLKRRFGKSADELRQLQSQLHSLEKHRAELNEELSAARERHSKSNNGTAA